jgi:dihydrofolate reductase
MCLNLSPLMESYKPQAGQRKIPVPASRMAGGQVTRGHHSGRNIMTCAQPSNTTTRYVASNTMISHEWQPSVFLNGDIAEKITKIKQQEGPDLHVFGSANLVQTLNHDLVDAFWLKIFPITLGGGKQLFADGTIPAAFKVTESAVTSKCVIIVNYERAGAVPTGSL